MSQRITIQIIDKIATCLTELPIVCGNSDYECEFLFDEEWDEHSLKTARFKVNGEYTDVVFEGNICNMPIISNCKIVWIGVFAGELSTSTPAIVHCKPSILDGEDTPAPPREDVYSQIVTMCEEAVETARSVEERANNGEFNGKDGEDGKDAEVDTSNLSNALKGNKQGEVIAINDCSPIGNGIAVKVASKNLCDNIFEIGGIYIDSGVDSTNANCRRSVNYHAIQPNTVYTLSKGGIDGSVRFRFYDKDKNYIGYKLSAVDVGKISRTFTSAENAYYVRFDITTSVDDFLLQLELGATATAYTPYVDVSAAKVQRFGKNILDINKTRPYAENYDAVTVFGDAVSVTPKDDRGSYGVIFDGINLVVGETYSFSMESLTDHGGAWGWRLRYDDGTYSDHSNSLSVLIKIEKSVNKVLFYVGSRYTGGKEVILSKPQIELNTATAYAPYIAPTEYAVNADGTVEGVTSLYPTTTIMTDTDGAVIDVEYNRDLNKAYQELYNAIISLGGNV